MVLVHDDDLTQISGNRDSEVNEHHVSFLVSSCSHLQAQETLQPDVVESSLHRSNVEIHTDLFRKRVRVSHLT
jgi:hypothetical protein